MRTKRAASLAALSVGALFLGACGSAGGGTESEATEDANLASSISVAISQAPDFYNGGTSKSNSVYNTYVDNLVHSNFSEYSPEGVIRNEEFGTFEKTSDDPLTVKYTINEDAQWSDGTPIDFDDILLNWAAFSGKVLEGEAEIFEPSSNNGYEYLAMPEGEAGAKEFEYVFETPYADWENLMIGSLMPAHIAAEQGGMSSENDGEELIAAIQDSDIAGLKPVAEFWNTGWGYAEGLPSLPDAALIPSSGPYKLDNAAGGNLTLTKNENYWGDEREAATESIIFKTIEDTEAVQALQNGDVDIIEPSGPTGDTKDQIEAIGDSVTTVTDTGMTFTHIDLDQSENGVFKDLKVREAFSKCVPRQDIVDKFVTPVAPDATVLNLREYQQSQPEYEEVLEAAPSASKYDEVDLEGAKELMEEAGKTAPVDVRMLFSSASQLRADITALIKASCDQAGFNIIASPDAEWTTKLDELGSWDAALFGWAGSGLVASGQSIYDSEGVQNYGKFKSEKVDELWDEIATTTDADRVLELKKELEEELAKNVYNVVLYTQAEIVAHNSSMENVVYNPTQSGVTWNAFKWTKQA
ncbi:MULTISPECIES: ABC transporter family substrate-binding protein [unclassified Arthrobacter]|uniref:ABC transporter family substrate-binding protein n=1 Tax=unclassified Arthrobacter TaxID=235627 RepID=UPI001E4843B1|nr:MULTISPECIES: ABC transporter family substrate-binding protein [unclassified Arthrobacter]MCC9146507.1 ABC transporter family substrate-binding protein [Arthrobacter sp. zg-Y919]MDK1277737.1 ABC transporter family substrate-binding protein [Arthrobacter sp. zg.Y919]WIB02307.1 ABC transporter family substrate-binding protein [Arthrobacter sp. zg-Y919]